MFKVYRNNGFDLSFEIFHLKKKCMYVYIYTNTIFRNALTYYMFVYEIHKRKKHLYSEAYNDVQFPN